MGDAIAGASREQRAGGVEGSDDSLIALARKADRLDDPLARDRIGEVRADSLVAAEASKRISQGMRTGHLNDQGAALSRLLSGVNRTRHSTVAFELAGEAAVAWDGEDEDLGRVGVGFLSRQAGQIGGGTTEMARNVISERVLGMPRERAADREVSYRDAPKSRATHTISQSLSRRPQSRRGRSSLKNSCQKAWWRVSIGMSWSRIARWAVGAMRWSAR